MNSVIRGTLEQLDELTELSDTGNLFDGAVLHLFKGNINLDQSTTLAELAAVVADFSGYATSAAVVWAAPFIDQNGQATLAGGGKTFATTSPLSVSNTVYGWYLTNGASNKLLFARRFDAPIIIATHPQAVVVIPAVPAFLSE